MDVPALAHWQMDQLLSFISSSSVDTPATEGSVFDWESGVCMAPTPNAPHCCMQARTRGRLPPRMKRVPFTEIDPNQLQAPKRGKTDKQGAGKPLALKLLEPPATGGSQAHAGQQAPAPAPPAYHAGSSGAEGVQVATQPIQRQVPACDDVEMADAAAAAAVEQQVDAAPTQTQPSTRGGSISTGRGGTKPGQRSMLDFVPGKKGPAAPAAQQAKPGKARPKSAAPIPESQPQQQQQRPWDFAEVKQHQQQWFDHPNGPIAGIAAEMQESSTGFQPITPSSKQLAFVSSAEGLSLSSLAEKLRLQAPPTLSEQRARQSLLEHEAAAQICRTTQEDEATRLGSFCWVEGFPVDMRTPQRRMLKDTSSHASLTTPVFLAQSMENAVAEQLALRSNGGPSSAAHDLKTTADHWDAKPEAGPEDVPRASLLLTAYPVILACGTKLAQKGLRMAREQLGGSYVPVGAMFGMSPESAWATTFTASATDQQGQVQQVHLTRVVIHLVHPQMLIPTKATAVDDGRVVDRVIAALRHAAGAGPATLSVAAFVEARFSALPPGSQGCHSSVQAKRALEWKNCKPQALSRAEQGRLDAAAASVGLTSSELAAMFIMKDPVRAAKARELGIDCTPAAILCSLCGQEAMRRQAAAIGTKAPMPAGWTVDELSLLPAKQRALVVSEAQRRRGATITDKASAASQQAVAKKIEEGHANPVYAGKGAVGGSKDYQKNDVRTDGSLVTKPTRQAKGDGGSKSTLSTDQARQNRSTDRCPRCSLAYGYATGPCQIQHAPFPSGPGGVRSNCARTAGYYADKLVHTSEAGAETAGCRVPTAEEAAKALADLDAACNVGVEACNEAIKKRAAELAKLQLAKP